MSEATSRSWQCAAPFKRERLPELHSNGYMALIPSPWSNAPPFQCHSLQLQYVTFYPLLPAEYASSRPFLNPGYKVRNDDVDKEDDGTKGEDERKA